MLQRKQTLFLLLSIAVSTWCLAMPLGVFSPIQTMETDIQLFNLWMVMQDGSRSFSVWPLFCLLLMSCTNAAYCITAYKNRPFQSKLCMFNILLIIGWYIYLVLVGYVFNKPMDNSEFQPSWPSILPLVVLIFHVLARRGIIADEKLVRSADRFR